jgi:Fcf2 pre-rRNA processing
VKHVRQPWESSRDRDAEFPGMTLSVLMLSCLGQARDRISNSAVGLWLTTSLHTWLAQITDEVKRDLRLLRLRGAFDTKRFYKKLDGKFPKYFQMGTVIEPAAEFYSSESASGTAGWET